MIDTVCNYDYRYPETSTPEDVSPPCFTYGNGICRFLPSYTTPVFRELCKKLDSIGNDNIRLQAKRLCNDLIQSLTEEKISVPLPQFIVEIDDEETYIEWNFTNFTIGFSLENEAKKSGWFMVGDDEDGHFSFDELFNGKYVQASRAITSYIKAHA